MRPKILGLYLLLSVIWGTTWLVLKVSLEGTPPILGVALRFTISAFVLWIVFFQKKEKLIITPQAIKVYLAFGILNFATSYSLTYWGTQFIYSGLSAILWATLPIFVVLFAHFMLSDDYLNLKKVLGGAIGLIGTFLIFFQGGDSEINLNMIGIIAVLFAVMIAAWPNVFYKQHQHQIPALHLNVSAQTIAVVILFPMSWLLEDPTTMVWNTINTLALFYLAIFGTVITWSIYLWLFSQISVTQISTVALVPPVVAAFLGWIFLGEIFTPKMIMGAFLVLLGVFILNMQQRTRKKMES